MDITVNIKAPSIVEAINKLADALGAGVAGFIGESAQPVIEANAVQITPAPMPEVIPQTEPAPTPTPITQPQPSVQPVTAQPQVNTAPAMTSIPVQHPPVPVAVPTAPTQPAPTAQPVVNKEYVNKVCNAAARLVEQGKMNELLATLAAFGVQSIQQLSAVQMPEFVNRIVQLGAVIEVA